MLISSLGGSAIEQWIPEERLLQFEEQAELKRLADDAIEARSDKGQGLWMREDFDDSSWESINNPTYLATSYHTGEWNDIHPLNKKDLAATLLLGARKLCYGEKVDAMGPVYREMKIDGDRIILYFDEARGGLKTSDGGKLKHFAIAGEDGKFVWADAVIKGSTVIVSSPEIKHPKAVRYAWANNPEDANLCNKAGLLASPFRTDNYPKANEKNITTDFGTGA